MKKIKASIIGGTGYTAGELLRILLNHPDVEVESVVSSTSAGNLVAEAHRDLLGETDLCFTATFTDPDVVFLCLGNGLSRAFLDENSLSPSCKIIDLGSDFRNQPCYANRNFVFGLCESNKTLIRNAQAQ